MKHSRTDYSSTAREISKCMDKSNMIHYKDLLCEIKYVIITKDYCHHMKPYRNINGTWKLRGYSDTEYAGDNDTRKFATG